MNDYVISATSNPALAAAVQKLGGRAIHPTCWIAPWEGGAVSLWRLLTSCLPRAHTRMCP
jgi:hypothetical protein